MKKTHWALILLLILASASSAKENEPTVGAGTTAEVGSGGYSKLSLYADGLWHAARADPYAWTELSSDNFVREFSFGGGVWKDVQDDLRIKGGAGLIVGRIKDVDNTTGSSLFLETGVEKDFERPLVGAEYSLTSGSIVGSTALRGAEDQVRQRDRGRAAAAASTNLEHLTYSEFSGYVKLPAGKITPGLRLTLGLPSYSRSDFTETLSCKIAATKAFSVTPAVSFEEGLANYVYFSLGLYYLFY